MLVKCAIRNCGDFTGIHYNPSHRTCGAGEEVGSACPGHDICLLAACPGQTMATQGFRILLGDKHVGTERGIAVGKAV